MIDHVALLPAYLAAGTAIAAFLADLVMPGQRLAAASTAAGAFLTGLAAILVSRGPVRRTFCAGTDCSYVANHRAALVAALFAGLTLAVVALAVPDRRPGEFYFLLGCAMTGGVVIGYAGDLITLIVALETLTLPLYALVAMRLTSADRGPLRQAARLTSADRGPLRQAARLTSADRGPLRQAARLTSADRGPLRQAARPGAVDAAVTFFVVSVVSTSVALLGAALLYAGTGAVHFGRLAAALAAGHRLPLTTAGVVLLLAGLSFKVAAVPFHAWAPPTYDGAPLPVAAFLSTASKLGGVVAILYVALDALRPAYDIVGPTIAVLAVLSMTVGNLVALRQGRMVRLLAWSSVAQAGYLLAPLGVTTPGAVSGAASLGYTFLYVLLELGAFGAVIALRGEDGGRIADYAGAARRSPWAAGALALALIGLAGLPPGLAGLFAKVVVVRALLSTGTGWLAVVVALNAVLGLAYYLRAAATLFGPADPAPGPRIPWPVAAALAGATLAAVVVGFAPQLVLAAVAAQP